MTTFTDRGPWPWQQSIWQQLEIQIDQNSLPHALLLQGMSGLGQRHFAQVLAQRLLCLHPANGLPCHQCSACGQVRQAVHPDFLVVEREDKARQLKIEQIRDAVKFIQTTAFRWRIVVIDAAETMNINAQNALLKTLEEPGPAALFVLISYRSLGLLATVRSRCQVVTFTPAQSSPALLTWWQSYQATFDAKAWEYFVEESSRESEAEGKSMQVTEADVTNWLQQAHGAPLIAWQMQVPGRKIASQQLLAALNGIRTRTQGISRVVDLLNHWPMHEALQALMTIIQQRLQDCLQERLQQTLQPGLLAIPLSETPRFLCQFYQQLLTKWQCCQQGVAMNETLLWEELLLCWAQQSLGHQSLV